MKNSPKSSDTTKVISSLPRITLKRISNEILTVFNLDKGFFYTFFEILKRPFESIQSYLYKDRSKLVNPFRFLILTVAAQVLIMRIHQGGFHLIEKMNAKNIEKFKANDLVIEATTKSQEFAFQYMNIISLLSIPLISFATYYLFRKMKMNYAEHLVTNSFITGCGSAISFLVGLLTFYIKNDFSAYIFSFASIPVGVYLYRNIFQQKWLWATLKYLLILLIILLISGIVQVGYMMIYVMKHSG